MKFGPTGHLNQTWLRYCGLGGIQGDDASPCGANHKVHNKKSGTFELGSEVVSVFEDQFQVTKMHVTRLLRSPPELTYLLLFKFR